MLILRNNDSILYREPTDHNLSTFFTISLLVQSWWNSSFMEASPETSDQSQNKIQCQLERRLLLFLTHCIYLRFYFSR